MQRRIAICDDCGEQREYLAGLVAAWAKKVRATADIRTFPSAEAFLFSYAEEKDYDILLLDVEMPGMSGVELAREVRRENAAVQIVFITGYYEYFSDGFDVSALHYLMKPVKQDKLFGVLDRAVAAMQKTERVILLPVSGEMLRLPVGQVQYVEVFSHTVAIVTKTDTIQVKMPISEIEKLLGDGFIRCHRSYLIGVKHIARLSKTEVILDSGKTLPLSRSAAAMVHKAFIFYYTGEEDETV